MRRVAAVAQFFVEDAQEDLEDDIAVRIAVGLGVDVEEDDVGTALHRALDIGQQHGVLDLLLIEELGRPLGGAVLRIHRFDVLQQVGKDLDEVRLAGTEEARDPDAHARREDGILGIVGSRQEGIEETAEIFGELLGDDVLVEFLPDAFGVALIGLDDAVDRAVDRLGEEVPDFHCWFFRGEGGFRKRGGMPGSNGRPSGG